MLMVLLLQLRTRNPVLFCGILDLEKITFIQSKATAGKALSLLETFTFIQSKATAANCQYESMDYGLRAKLPHSAQH